MFSRTVIWGVTAKITQTCVLFSIFQLVCQIEKWLDDPKQSRTINYRRTHSHAHTHTLTLTHRVRVRDRLLSKFLQTDLYLIRSEKSMSVPLSWIKSVFLWPHRLCLFAAETKTFFKTSPTIETKCVPHKRPNSAIQLLIDFYNKK